jgi:hypothetical protein
MLRENFRYDKEQCKQQIIQRMNQKRVQKQLISKAVSMNVDTSLGDGVEPYSEQVRKQKHRKLHS